MRNVGLIFSLRSRELRERDIALPRGGSGGFLLFSFVFFGLFVFVFFFFEFFFSSSKPLKPRKLKIRIQQIFYTYMKFTSFSVCLLAAIDPFNCHKNIKCYVCAESIISVSDLKLCFFN